MTNSEKIKLEWLKQECEESHLAFTRYFFKKRHNIKFKVNWHHVFICDVLEKVLTGEIENVVITVPPGSSKTELAVINFIARGLAKNPRARFLHLSGSDSLAMLNSSTARDIITSDAFQGLWPLRIKDDSKSKKRWNVELDGQEAGGVYATSLGGQITGFRAGHMAPGFQGAIIVDDPIKPEDAFSKVRLEAANRKFVTTVKSRRANPKTPIILIMQRIAENDPAGFIKSGNMEGEWTFIRIPAIIDKKYLRALEKKYRDLIEPDETDDKGRFSYWQYKEPIQDLASMERGDGLDQSGAKISRHVYSAQYDQNPVALGGNMIRGEYFGRYTTPPKIKWRKVFVDTAQKTKERNDFTVFGEFGLGDDGKAYLLDLIRGRWEAPELKRRAVAFWAKVKARDVEKFGRLREMPVEDKASGTGLIQELKLPPHNIPVRAIQREKDKLTRVMDVLSYIEVGSVSIPEGAPFTNDFVQECEAFSPDDTHAFDDQVDILCDAIVDLLAAGNKMKVWEAVGKN
jgi:predicted phage terminase large subunit-like protein